VARGSTFRFSHWLAS